MRKSAALPFILILALTSLIAITPAFAQTTTPSPIVIPELSAPTFSVKYIQSSYITTVIDPYTGQSVTQQKDNNTIEVTIQNQPFTPYYDASCNITTALFYSFQVKGHYEENWTPIYAPGYNTIQSNSSYTTLLLPADYQAGSQIDFQVKATIGGYLSPPGAPYPAYQSYPLYYVNQTSDWGNTQTLTIPEPESFDWVQLALLSLLAVAVIVVLLVVVIVYRRKRSVK